MGVQGLWRLIESTGKPVPLETLENKVLAIDISIWLHQAIKGFQDAKGGMLPNAHLLGIYHRICKLLYYRIKPVFVFDGGVPVLKRETIAKRNQVKARNLNDANSLQKQLLNSLIKHSAINVVLSEKAKAALENDVQKASASQSLQNDVMFEIPPSQIELINDQSDEESSSSDGDHMHITKHWDLHTIDQESEKFKSLPANIRHEILVELKDTRKQSSWGRIHELPTQSDDFSGYQMKRLLKRHSVQISLEEVEKEIGGYTLSLEELEKLLSIHGVLDPTTIVGRRIASDENKRFVYIKNLKGVLEKVSNEEISSNGKEKDDSGLVECGSSGTSQEKLSSSSENEEFESNTAKSKANIEYEQDLDAAIKLSLQDEGTTTGNLCDRRTENIEDDEYEKDITEAIRLSLRDQASTSKETSVGSSQTSDTLISSSWNEENYFSDSSDDSVDSNLGYKVLASAKNYMMEYSGLPPTEILKIINGNSNSVTKDPKRDVDSVIKKVSEPKKNNLRKLLTQPEKSNGSVSETKNPSETENDSGLKPFGSVSSDKKLSEEVTASNDVVLMSDSDSSDDFEEVTSSLKNNDFKPDEKTLEIKFEKVSKLDDDLFSDIFANNNVNKKESIDLQVKKPLNIDKITENPISPTENEIVVVVDNENHRNNPVKEVNDDKKDQSDSLKEVLKSPRKDAEENIDEKVEVTSKDEFNSGTNESALLKDILMLKSKNEEPKTTLTTTELKEIQKDLARETNRLITEKAAKERIASNITEQMCLEAQELLQLFGVPYIIAPMEAEAQCAFLNEINLTDGTITDDSDIWLFGGKTVYKNFFNQSKYIMEFKVDDIQQSFKLSRHEMILLALLVGSDYTTGLKGVGPVTALEILSTFPSSKNDQFRLNYLQLLSGLREFRRWFNNDGYFKGSKSTKAALRKKLQNVEITEHFPSPQVVQAYLEPAVETSEESFSWSKPDRENLIEFARQKFGWQQMKSEKILDPVLKRLEETGTQTKITNYFKIKHKIERNLAEDKMSKRVRKAINNMDKDADESTGESTDVPKEVEKNKKAPKSSRSNKAKKPPIDEDVKVLNETKKLSRHKIKEMKIALNEMLLKAEREANAPSTHSVISNRVLRKETIPQKEKHKADSLKNKLKAVEIFRMSKQGPGYVKKRKKIVKLPKEDAGLSENSDS